MCKTQDIRDIVIVSALFLPHLRRAPQRENGGRYDQAVNSPRKRRAV